MNHDILSSFSFLETLNTPQQQAVLNLDGPLLVLAGAGTGKTRVLISRIVHILNTQRAYPSEILAVTFTNKAAQEMKQRVGDLLGHSVEGLWLGTFHSLCSRILRSHAELLGLETSFTILDKDDQLRLIKELLKLENIDDKHYPARAYEYAISRLKDQALTPEQISHAPKELLTLPKVSHIYTLYQQRLKILNAVDFGDLILHTITLFRSFPDVLEHYQNKFKFILVDEYQDTNIAQYLWLRLLAQKTHSICCVGDDDQSIYGWRGAEVGNILRFEQDFKDAQIIRLEQNYRSTPHILKAASHLISHNEGRLGKTLWTEESSGHKIKVKGMWDGSEEARFVSDEIENLHLKGYPLSEMAILVRAGFQTRSFEERLLNIAIPYRVIGGLRFYERLEIRDAIAYLRIVVQPRDSLAFERILNTPRRGIGETTVQLLHETAREQNLSLLEAARFLLQTVMIKGAAQRGLTTLLSNLSQWSSLLSQEEPSLLAKRILEESGYTDFWAQDKSPDAPGRLENLKELVTAIQEFPSLTGFLEHISLIMDNAAQTQGDQVTLMTLHSAKGLEFQTVFLVGWEENVFPHARSLNEQGKKGLEEERRLAYVGITRARSNVYITYAANRQIYNQWQSSYPSRFIQELPNEDIEHEGLQGMHFSQSFQEKPAFSSTFTKFSEKRSFSFPSSTQKQSLYKIRERVFHEKFGYGIIQSIEGDRLEIDFDKAGLKKIISDFISKAS
ncbi:MAG: UvrD-helicase domain-containing protein [Proteobacteria bacterium]|nr:UvrD-helicase domain-containing protein [Pseudomonadota bacterium]